MTSLHLEMPLTIFFMKKNQNPQSFMIWTECLLTQSSPSSLSRQLVSIAPCPSLHQMGCIWMWNKKSDWR